ncbi:MAG: hypothetical protein SOT25_03470 [Malacoplasma sp.]|nr:hypothetical protein [Mycoplasmataceae bacterium]MDY2887811.1 hypothetical protein [Malacoplasma sp.]
MNNKKLIPLMAGCMSLILVSSTILVVSNFFNKETDIPIPKDIKPLNRGDNYEHYDISSYFKKYANFEEISTYKTIDGKIVKSIDKEKVKKFFKDNLKNILLQINKFKSKADQYLFTVNFQISPDSKSLLFDLVWNLPNSSFFYYDQLKVFML